MINLKRMRLPGEFFFHSMAKCKKKKKRDIKVNANIKFMPLKIYKDIVCNVVKAQKHFKKEIIRIRVCLLNEK